MSMITPPIAMAAFAAAAIAKAPAMATGWAAMRFGWAAYVIPVLFVFSPSLILVGETGEIIFAVITAGLGVWLVSAGLAGYFSDRLSPLKRLLFVATGLMALVPAGAFKGAILTDAAGVVLGLALIASEMFRRRAVPLAPEEAQ
jgi:TRAP-type uncharacterized transport system fused permease subunit